MLLSLREVVDKYELMAKKSLGQNFLLDLNITRKIVRESLVKQGKSDFSKMNMIEIGPGPGGLTRAVIETNPKSLTVIEMDDRCIEIMRELKDQYKQPMNIIQGDAMKCDIVSITQEPRGIISNLPYNISVPLLTNWLENAEQYDNLTLMFQKEVADRIVANIGSKEYGRISVLAQLTCKITRLFDLNPQNFVPAPKVWSTVLLFQPHREQPEKKVLNIVEKLTAKAFGQRRKMLRQSLKSIVGIKDILNEQKIPEDLRAENITPQEYLKIAENIATKSIDVQ